MALIHFATGHDWLVCCSVMTSLLVDHWPHAFPLLSLFTALVFVMAMESAGWIWGSILYKLLWGSIDLIYCLTMLNIHKTVPGLPSQGLQPIVTALKKISGCPKAMTFWCRWVFRLVIDLLVWGLVVSCALLSYFFEVSLLLGTLHYR